MPRYESGLDFLKRILADLDALKDVRRLLVRANRELMMAAKLSNETVGLEVSSVAIEDYAVRLEAFQGDQKLLEQYASSLHDLVQGYDIDFTKRISKVYERMSMIDLYNYTIENTLGVQKVFDVNEGYDESVSILYNSAGEKTNPYKMDDTKYISIDDVLHVTNMGGYRDAYKRYKSQMLSNQNLDMKQLETFRKNYYKRLMTTTYNHEMFATDGEKMREWFLNRVPVVGAVKLIVDGFTGETALGELKNNEERFMSAVGGAVLLWIDFKVLESSGFGGFLVEAGGRVGTGLILDLGTAYMVENNWNPHAILAVQTAGGLVSYGVLRSAGNKIVYNSKELLGLGKLGVTSGGVSNVQAERGGFLDGMSSQDALRYRQWHAQVSNGLTQMERYDLFVLEYGVNSGLVQVGVKDMESGPGNWKQSNESMSDLSRNYQKYITDANEGMVYELDGVKFDGFDGTNLLDAKANYANFVDQNGNFYNWFNGKNSLMNQAINQLDVANGVPVKWYFNDPVSMNAVQNLLNAEGIKGIEFILKPMP